MNLRQYESASTYECIIYLNSGRVGLCTSNPSDNNWTWNGGPFNELDLSTSLCKHYIIIVLVIVLKAHYPTIVHSNISIKYNNVHIGFILLYYL